MAFISPALPTSTRPIRPKQTTPCASSDGIISVSRRRRIFEFLRETSAAPPPSSDGATHPGAPATSDDRNAAVSKDISAARAAAIAGATERFIAFQAAIAADSAQKREEWEAVLADLRTPPKPEPRISVVESLQVDPPLQAIAPIPAPVDKPVQFAPSVELPPPVPPPAPGPPVKPPPTFSSYSPSYEVSATPISEPAAIKSAPVYMPKGTSQPPLSPKPTSPIPAPLAPNTIDAASPNSESMRTVSDLYQPSSSTPAQESVETSQSSSSVEPSSADRDVLRAVVDATTEAIKKAANVFENITDSKSDQRKEEEVVGNIFSDITEELKKESPEIFDSQEDNTETVAQEPETSKTLDAKKTLGEKILDAIVEGVPTPKDGTSPAEDVVMGKTEVLELVESGKIKNLTVTKLRRLLSSNSLKTSGRKSELIARLTSFAKSK